MPRPRKPASLQSGHHMNKEEREKQIKREQFLGGSASSIAEPPKYLSKRAKKYYVYIYRNLKDSGVLTNLDVFIVSETAICLDRMKECDEILNQQGLIKYRFTKDGSYLPFEHPAVNIKKKYMGQFKTLSTQLGLTPSSRSQLASVNVDTAMKKKDPLNELISKLHNGDS